MTSPNRNGFPGQIARDPSPDICDIQLVGGAETQEGRRLADSVRADGLTLCWHSLTCPAGQSALAAQPPGAVSLPLVIIDQDLVLQRPSLTTLAECLAQRSRIPARSVQN